MIFNRSNSYTIAVANTISGTAGALTQNGSGTLIFPAGNSSTYGGATTVSSSVLEVDGAITSAVTVASGATLTGTGSTGAVTADSGGNLFLASAVSALSNATLNLPAGAAFNAYIASDSSYSQDTVASGSVTLGATLNLSALPSYSPAGGETFTIINNNGGAAINGIFLAGSGMDAVSPGTPLPEGAVLSNNYLGSGHVAKITYKAGANHDNVAILVSNTLPLAYTSSTDPNNFLLNETAGGTLQIFDNNFLVPVATLNAALTSLVQIGVAAGLDATLTIDYTNSFTVPVVFNGGTGTASPHTLTLENASYTTATFTDTNASSGTVALDGETVSYSNVTSAIATTPAIIDQSETNLVFNHAGRRPVGLCKTTTAATDGNLPDQHARTTAASCPPTYYVRDPNGTLSTGSMPAAAAA